MEQEQEQAIDAEEFDFDLGAQVAGPEASDALGEVGAPQRERTDERVRTDDRPADVRIAELFERMARQRRLLLGILEHCATPRTLASIRERVGSLQENHRSVFGLDTVCAQLEQAGALARVLESGEPYAYDEDAEPQTEVVDGVERIKPRTPPTVFWLTTDAGRAKLASHDPAAKLAKLLQDDEAYLPIYERVLTLCAAQGGSTMAELGRAVDGDPLVQSPRFYAAHFVNNLEACEAVSWESGWVTTEVGLRGLAMLADGTLFSGAVGGALADETGER